VAHGEGLWQALQRRCELNGADPVITWIDHDLRTELSGRTLQNAAAKAANALRDEFGIGPGDVIAAHLPWHWQRSVWVTAITAIGATISPFGSAGALAICSPEAAGRLTGGAFEEVLVVSMHPFGLSQPDQVPTGCLDAAQLVMSHGDFLSPSGSFACQWPSWPPCTDRVLVSCADALADASWQWAACSPIMDGGSIVMTGDGADLDVIAQTERSDRIVCI